jgi:hypothetical protein
MAKKPKSDAKINQLRLALSNDELERLNFICEFYNLSRAALFRQFLDETYKKTKKKD